MKSEFTEIKQIDSISPSPNTPAFRLATSLSLYTGAEIELSFESSKAYADGISELGIETRYEIVLPSGGGTVSFKAKVIAVHGSVISLLIIGDVIIEDMGKVRT